MTLPVDPGARIGWYHPGGGGAQTGRAIAEQIYLSVVYLVCSYCRRLRDPMIQSLVMIVSFFSSLPLPSALNFERDLSTAIHTPVRLLRALAPMMFTLAARASPWAPQSPGLELSHATTDVGRGWVGLGGALA